MPEEVLILIVTGMVLGVPILGLTIRMVAKPMAEAIATLKDSISGPPGISMGDQRLMAVEEELDRLRKTVTRLEEGEEFSKALRAPQAQLKAQPPAQPQSLPSGPTPE